MIWDTFLAPFAEFGFLRRALVGCLVLSVSAPPLGVFLQVGIGLHFWLNILLTLFGYIPGIIHAIWVIIRK